MRSLALLIVVGCCALIGCRELSVEQAGESSTTNSLDSGPSDYGSPTGGSGNPDGFQRHGGGGGGRGFGGDPRAGRQDRPQRPELEE